MIPGMNMDVRYKGKTFHIQTEDSGPDNPVLITHVFLGGTILGTERQTYTEVLEQNEGAELETKVRELMRTQHRAMYKALQAGKFDDAARRPPRAKASRGSIPLAKKRKGIMTGSTKKRSGRSAPKSPAVSAPPQSVEVSSPPKPAQASVPPQAPSQVSLPPKTTTAPQPSIDIPAEGTIDDDEQITELSVLDLQPAEPRLPFPTALTGAQPLSDLALAYLIEEPNET